MVHARAINPDTGYRPGLWFVDVVNTLAYNGLTQSCQLPLVIVLPVIVNPRHNTLSRQTSAIVITMYLHFAKHCLTFSPSSGNIIDRTTLPERVYPRHNLNKFNTKVDLLFYVVLYLGNHPTLLFE